MSLVTYEDILRASQRLAGVAHHTPVMTSRTLNAQVGADVFLKCENYQRMGAFKFRGAYNAMSALDDETKKRGVVTYSSGNHAQAIALSGQLLGIKTTIVMPDDAPEIKLDATRGYGAEVVTYHPPEEDRKQVAEELAKTHGYAIIPPFDHVDVIAGQGTSAKELIDAVGELDYLLVCCGGGGLLSGCAIATKALSPRTRVIGVEPELGNDATRSFYTKQLVTIAYPNTIADGARTLALGQITFPLILEYVDDMVTVTEEAIKEAVRFAFYRMKMVIEPSGALALSALMSGAGRFQGRVGVLISGGNVDGAVMANILNR